MQASPQARWPVLSPLLDELLDVDGEARAARLADIRASDPALAAELQALLGELPRIEREAFLERPPLLPPATLAGQTIGPYTVERELGQGGMGSVWLARRTDGRYEGQVAIKFLNAGLMSRGGAERFAREGSILARLAHPHIARLLDAGVAREGTQPYLVLEYTDGQPINLHCDAMGLDLQQRVRLFLDVLAAVAHAHNRLILHRDIKPSNILVTQAGEVKLLDFGIAKLLDDATAPGEATELTRQAGRAFTPQYAAPEQLQDGDVTTATDVYALGVLLHVLLGGEHPTASGTTAPLEQMRAAIEVEPRRLSDTVLRRGGPHAARLARELRGDLDNIVARALKKAPAQRYANAAAFADDLQRYLRHEPVAARADGAAYVLAKFVRRHRLGVAASLVTVAALAAGISVALWQAREAQRQRVQAEGLIEFMLGDLRKKLQPVGRLDVMNAVGDKALAYYAAQDAQGLDANALGRKARALHLIGEIAERQGQLADASRVFEQAAATTAELMARAPADGQRVFDHAQSVYWVGYVARKRGELAQAEVSFRRYAELAEQLNRLDASNIDWRMERGHASTNLGVVHLEAWRAAEALAAFVAARDTWQAVAAERPEMKLKLADSWGWISKAREVMGQFDDAVNAQQTKMSVLQQMPDAAKNRNAQRQLAAAELALARLYLAQGEYSPAAQVARRALESMEALQTLDPSNTWWLAQATATRVSLAHAQWALGQRDDARATLQRAAADIAKLQGTDATRPQWNITLRGAVLQQQALQRPDASGTLLHDMQAYVLEAQQTAAKMGRLDADETLAVAAAELALGDLLRSNSAPQAAAHWQSAAQRLKAPAASGVLSAMTLLAHADLRLGLNAEARRLAERIETSSYRHPAYADLRRRLAAEAGAAPTP
ncbi:serine/threonine-protein kinase [Ideonella sp. BN130291]|uniref:serine/threonine-protein kinase n=1 Tax=Ideonella sp. BN130291 TaxID=3112940 RepID=UPI002E2659DE|nr:protein kinase [Ideonella sp. BN130291]